MAAAVGRRVEPAQQQPHEHDDQRDEREIEQIEDLQAKLGLERRRDAGDAVGALGEPASR